MIRINWSRLRVWAAKHMLVAGRRIIEQEELRWGLRQAPGWRVPNTP